MLAMIHTLPFPNSTKLYRVLADFGHAPVFAAIAFASLQIAWVTRRLRPKHPARREYAIAALTVILLAIASELAQMKDPGRSASFLDILRDVAGGSLGLVYCAVRYESRKTMKKPQCRILAAMCIILIAFLIAPIVWTIAAYINRDAKWPTILSMDTSLDRVLLHPYKSQIQTINLPSVSDHEKDEVGLLVASSNSVDSGITIQDLGSDWHAFDRICADITNLSSISVEARMHLGNAPNIFRSTVLRKISIILPAQSRVTHCNPLYSKAENVISPYQSVSAYGSISVLTRAAGTVQEFIVHRIWLE